MPALEGSSWSLSAEQLLDRIASNRWVPLAVNVAAFALLTYGLARWTWRVLEPPTGPVAVSSLPSPAQATPFDPQAVLAAHLFGQPQGGPSTAIDPQRLPLSSLNIVLTGVLARGPGSFAFLSINGAPEAPVTIGQDVTAGAVLHAVFPDRIVVRRGTALESVLLKDSELALPDGSIMSPSAAGAADAVRSLGGGTYTVDRQALTQSLTPEVLSQAAVAPGAGGLVMRDVESGSVFEKLGLRPGDVVRYINGQPVHDLEDVMRIYAQTTAAPQAGPIAVEVSRGGRTEVLQYRMR